MLEIDSTSRNRLNSVYMGLFFVEGAIASSLAGPLFSFQWVAVVSVGTGLPLVALAGYLMHGRDAVGDQSLVESSTKQSA